MSSIKDDFSTALVSSLTTASFKLFCIYNFDVDCRFVPSLLRSAPSPSVLAFDDISRSLVAAASAAVAVIVAEDAGGKESLKWLHVKYFAM
jgi:hypothetical protein